MSETTEDPTKDGDGSRASNEDVAKEEDGEEAAPMFGPNKSSTSVVQKNSVSASITGLKTTHSEEALNPDDVKRLITFSPSITEALNGTVTPMRDIQITQVHKDQEQSILQKAILRLKEDFSESRAVNELTKMYDLYTSSIVDNSLLEAQCHELQNKTKQYEERHQWDPRVLKVLLVAEKYRQEKASVADEKGELEAEVMDVTMELKHLEDIIKAKNKDIAKLQDELKKAKEIEKQVEHLETLIMKKDNEKQTLQEHFEAIVNGKEKMETHHNPDRYRQSLAPTEEMKFAAIERDMMARIDHITAEKLVLKGELEEKGKALQLLDGRIMQLKVDNSELENARRDNIRVIAKMESENNRLMNTTGRLEKKVSLLRDQLAAAKSEVISTKASYEGCVNCTHALTHEIKQKAKDNIGYQKQVSTMNEKLTKLKDEQKACSNLVSLITQESRAKDIDLQTQQRLLSDKKAECENIATRLFKLEQFKVQQQEMMKLTRLNTEQLIKEITSLRASLVNEKMTASKTEDAMMRIQMQIETLQREYLNVLEKNMLLVRGHEMAASAIDQLESNKVATDRRIAYLMKTNIDLYTQTTSQQEIALLQNHQFHLKENEIKGLLSRLEEEDHKMEIMVCKDKEKRGTIEQLHTEANSREEKIKTLKSIIESYTQLNKSINDKVEQLTTELRVCQTQKEMVRRQRDLFGTKLLNSRAETDLCQESLRTAKDTIRNYATEYYNMQNDLRVLKLEIKNLRRKNKLAEGQADLILTLRQELGQATKALDLQKCKNVFLEQTHMPRAHRWRGLLASDPSKYEMVLKNQLLIKRLIAKTNETARLEELLKQKDTMYLSLRVLVQRRMTADLTPEMCAAKANLRKKSRQLKSLTAELNVVNDEKKQAQAKEELHKTRMSNIFREQTREKIYNRRHNQKTRLPPLTLNGRLKRRFPHLSSNNKPTTVREIRENGVKLTIN